MVNTYYRSTTENNYCFLALAPLYPVVGGRRWQLEWWRRRRLIRIYKRRDLRGGRVYEIREKTSTDRMERWAAGRTRQRFEGRLAIN